MRLLIITQKVDSADPVLGFFHNWIIKLSEKFDAVTVICLEKGEYSLPSNVKVLSLGKERGAGKLKYIFNFYKYILGEFRNYDAVFVHMNEEYVLLGGLLWNIARKRVYMWRNHPKGSIFTRIAVLLSNKVFCTSPFSFTARFRKTVLMPVGIDTSLFNAEVRNDKTDTRTSKLVPRILFLGRIAPIKNVHMFVEAMNILKNKGFQFEANIYGDALPKDAVYFEDVKNAVKNRGLLQEVKFMGPVSNSETPRIYAAHHIYVNLTPTGSMDKTIFEACAAGAIPVVTNMSLKEDLGPTHVVYNPTAENIADKIESWLKQDDRKLSTTRGELVKYVKENHSLRALVLKLTSVLNSNVK
jgi:glycosyltransferase involved in cell wall biosynthesis